MCDSSMRAAFSVRVLLVPAAVDAMADCMAGEQASRGAAPARLRRGPRHAVAPDQRTKSLHVPHVLFWVSWGEVGATYQARRWLAPSTACGKCQGPDPSSLIFAAWLTRPLIRPRAFEGSS